MNINTPVPTIYGGMVQKLGDLWKSQIKSVQDKFGSSIEEIRMPGDTPTDVPILYVKKDAVIDLMRFLRDETGFEYCFLSDLTATDEEVEPRFEVVYQLFSWSSKSRIRVKTRVKENEEVQTLTVLWKAANWLEREVFDMYGVRFSGHPDLRRILMDERWQGHPLRKDYPLRGYQIFSTAQEINQKLLEEVQK